MTGGSVVDVGVVVVGSIAGSFLGAGRPAGVSNDAVARGLRARRVDNGV